MLALYIILGVLALFLLLGLLSGCDEEAEPTETAARPTVTTAPESEETEETTMTSLLPDSNEEVAAKRKRSISALIAKSFSI